MNSNTQRPPETYMLIFLLVFQSASALYGGAGLIFSPSGQFMQMPVDWLEKTPFHTFLIPGLILGILLGLLPLFLVFPLLFKLDWKWANVLNVYKDRYWAWTYSLYVGIMLVIWITVQIYWLGGGSFLQTLYSLVGLAILIASLLPRVERFYRL